MTDKRYIEIEKSHTISLTPEEIKEGWHFCYDWDGMLNGPEMFEYESCTCWKG